MAIASIIILEMKVMDQRLKTTLPDTLEAVFTAFRKHLPANEHQAMTVYKAWVATFQGEGVRASEMYARIGQVSDMLEETLLQIQAANTVTDAQKVTARKVIDKFSNTVELSRLNENAHQYLSKCDEDSIGTLGLFGHSLQRDFSYNVIPEGIVAEILGKLGECRAILQESEFPLRFKIFLLRQMDSLIWRLKRPDLESVQQIVDGLGRSALSANILEKICKDDGQKEAAASLRNGLYDCFAKVVTIMEFADLAASATKLTYEYVFPHLLSGPS